MSKRRRNFWIEAALFVLIVAAITTAIIASELQPLNKNDIKLTASDLRSFSAAGRQLTAQHQAGHLTDTFFNTQVESLNDKVSDARQSLIDSDAEPEAKQSQRTALDLASQIDATLDQMQGSPQNESSIAQQLSSLENNSKQLEDLLKNE